MEAQRPEPSEGDRQKPSALTKLPIEILYKVVSSLDTASILSLRLTCYLALHWVLPSFRKLLKSRKYFLHPYSFNLLEELSISPFAECVERIVIGTETFQDTFHLTAMEYGMTLTSTLQRFINLRAVEIRDFVPSSSMGYHDNDFIIDEPRMHTINQYFNAHSEDYPSPYEVQYNSRWGEEEDQDHPHSQGFRRISAGYSTLAFRKPPRDYRPHPPHPDPSDQLGELFTALLHACTVAKTAGVNVTDFRVALMYRWGIPDEYLAGFRDQDMSKFLSSLEILHLATYNMRGIDNDNIGFFTAACRSLKWIRVVFASLIFIDRESVNFSILFRRMGESSPVNRLELGGVDVNGWYLSYLIRSSRPKILNLWRATIREDRPDPDDDSEWGWGPMLRKVAGVVGQVRLVRARQFNGRHMKSVRLVQGGGVSTSPDVEHEYIHLSPDSVEAVVRDMVFSTEWQGEWAFH